MKKLLALFILSMILVLGCTQEQPDTPESSQEEATPLDSSMQNSAAIEKEFSTEEQDSFDQEMASLEQNFEGI